MTLNDLLIKLEHIKADKTLVVVRILLTRFAISHYPDIKLIRDNTVDRTFVKLRSQLLIYSSSLCFKRVCAS